MRSSTPLFRCYPEPIEDDEEAPQLCELEDVLADSDIAAEIDRVGHPWAGPMLIPDCESCLVIGHNVPFDLGAIAIHTGSPKRICMAVCRLSCRGGEHDKMVLNKEGVLKKQFEYRVAIKKLGFGKSLYRDGKQINGTRIDQLGKIRPHSMALVHYVDTVTAGRALLGPGPTKMGALLRRLDCP
jgi:hypothetical protein